MVDALYERGKEEQAVIRSQIFVEDSRECCLFL